MTDLVEKLIFIMKDVEDRDLTGIEKKLMTLDTIRRDKEYSDNMDQIIRDIIDYIIYFDKGQMSINPKVKKCFSCIKL